MCIYIAAPIVVRAHAMCIYIAAPIVVVSGFHRELAPELIPGPGPKSSPSPELIPGPGPGPGPGPSPEPFQSPIPCPILNPTSLLNIHPSDPDQVTGFVASTEEGAPTTLKRSGSDYSARTQYALRPSGVYFFSQALGPRLLGTHAIYAMHIYIYMHTRRPSSRG